MSRPFVRGLTRARVLAAGLTIALAPLPLASADPAASATSSIDLRASVRRAAAAERLAPSSVALAEQPAGAATGPTSRSFFKTPLGVAVLAVVGGGTAYALYSAQHDRIHSAAR